MSPTVTAVIPLHNHEKWIQECIGGMVEQTYKNLRIVVVDDGSDDASLQKALELLESPRQIPTENEPLIWTGEIAKIPTIIASFEQARGPSFARNYGIKTGWEGTDLFAFCDSDDVYQPSKIEESVKVWLESPGLIGIIYSDYTAVNIHSGYKQRQFKEPFNRRRLMEECIINMDSVFAKWVFEKAGEFDTSLRTVEDLDMYLRATEFGMAVHIPKSLVDIRVGPHSSSSTVSKQDWEKNYRRVFEKTQERARSNA